MIDTSTLTLLDGATGTELERRGVDIALPLWSARALIEAPRVVEAIHADYLAAGSGAITANTFRTHGRSLGKAGLGHRAAELTKRAVALARAARDEHKPEALVLGSVAPLEDCYRPDLAPGAAACRAEHREMIGTLLEAGVDGILIETMNNLAEARAAAETAESLCPERWIISFCTAREGPPGILLSGEPLAGLLPALRGAQAIGVNCVSAPSLESQVRWLRAELGSGVPVIAYANVGRADAAGNWIATDAVSPDRFADYAWSWVEAGAAIVGGCCGTTPPTIRAIAERIGELDKPRQSRARRVK